jgi:hypothetical protein
VYFLCSSIYFVCVYVHSTPPNKKKKALCQKRKMSIYHDIFCFELTKDINHKYCQIMCICNSVRFGNFVVFLMVSLYSCFLCKALKITRLMMWILKLWYHLTVLVLVLIVDALFYCLSTWQFMIDKVLIIISVGDFNHRKLNLGFCLTLPTRLNFTCL